MHPLFLECTLSNHAIVRMQQRGIRVEDVAFVFLYGRCISRPREGNKFYIRNSDIPRHPIDPQQADRLNGLVIVLNDDGHVITVYHKHALRRDTRLRSVRSANIRRVKDWSPE